MKIYICQNHMIPDGVNYKERNKDDMNYELNQVQSKYDVDNVEFLTSARDLTEDDFKRIGVVHKITPVFCLGMDIGSIGTFTKNDLVIFTKDHFYDKYCNVILQVCSFYNIPYKALIE